MGTPRETEAERQQRLHEELRLAVAEDNWGHALYCMTELYTAPLMKWFCQEWPRYKSEVDDFCQDTFTSILILLQDRKFAFAYRNQDSTTEFVWLKAEHAAHKRHRYATGQRRDHRRNRDLTEAEGITVEQEPGQSLDATDMVTKIRAYVAHRDAIDLQILDLKLANKSVREIVDTLKQTHNTPLSENAVNLRWSRLTKLLRQEFDDNEGGAAVVKA